MFDQVGEDVAVEAVRACCVEWALGKACRGVDGREQVYGEVGGDCEGEGVEIGPV